MREDVMNFSLNYRHIAENNFENYQMLMVVHLQVSHRRCIRVLVYENDNIKELGHRLMTYLFQHNTLLLPHEYTDYLHESLVFYIESQLQDLGFSSP